MRSSCTGVVLKAGRGYAVVLTADGRFVKIKSRGVPPMVGEEISLPVPGERTFVSRLVPAVALACLMLFLSFFGYARYIEARPALAYVSVDSSGSVELEVNDKGLVRTARAFDAGGESLLQRVRYRFRPVEEVIEEMASIESKSGSSAFIVGIAPIKETEGTRALEAKIRQKVQKAARAFAPAGTQSQAATGQEETPNPMVNVFCFDLETREKAVSVSASPGRLFVWGLMRKSGALPEASAEESQASEAAAEQVRTSLPHISDVAGFAKLLKEHNDREKAKNVVEEMTKVLKKGKTDEESPDSGKQPGSGKPDKPGGPGKGSDTGGGKDTGNAKENEERAGKSTEKQRDEGEREPLGTSGKGSGGPAGTSDEKGDEESPGGEKGRPQKGGGPGSGEDRGAGTGQGPPRPKIR